MGDIKRLDIVDIELNSGNLHRSWLNHSIGSGDNNANGFGVRLFRNGEPVNIGAGWVQGFFRNSQGENIALTEHGAIAGNEAYVVLPQACYNYDGPFTLAIKLVSEGSTNTVTMRIVDGMVDNTNTGSAVAPTGTVPTYQEILAVYAQMQEDIADYESVVATQNGKIDDLKSAIKNENAFIIPSLIDLSADKVAETEKYPGTTTEYYRRFKSNYALNTTKTYNIAVTVSASGNYKIQAGNAATAGSMVDTIFDGYLVEGINYIINYTPTGAWTILRSDVNSVWDAVLYVSSSVQIKQSAEKSVQVMSLSTADFTSIYSNTIGNLPTQRIVNVTPSHNAVDFPLGISGYYTVLTIGEASSPVQIAVDINGHSYRRKKTLTGWKNWIDEAIDYSNILLAGQNPQYTDFNDFPIGSIITVSSLELTNSPEGYGNTGHDSMDTGPVTCNVITFATTPNDPYLISQICVQFNGPTQGTPRVSFRSGILISGSYVWSRWTTLNMEGVIHSTNKIVDIDHLNYTFDDFNDAPRNTIYQVDFNVANSVANNPAPGKSGSLMTYGFSDSSRHALTQIYITKDGPNELTASMHYRYCVQVGTNTYVWTDWLKVRTFDNAVLIENKGRLANGSDLNDVVDNAVYLLGNQATAEYEHSALSSGGGYLTVRANGDICQQIIDAFDGTRYSRYSSDAGTTWNSWN